MANTTNFGWETPDDTDLVKDGALAMRTLGNSIDTSMADLRGGTSGQILAKNSNTDMDFVWIANDQGDITGITASSPLTGGGTSGAVTIGIQDGTTTQKGAVQLENSISSTSTTTAAVPASVKSAYDLANAAIPKSIIDAAGDLIYGTANDTPARLALGTAGQVLTVNSGATAPEWATASGGKDNWVLLNAGGTALTGAATITVSGITNKNKIFILVDSAKAGATAGIGVRINGDTGNNYAVYGAKWISGTTNLYRTNTAAFGRIILGQQDNSTGAVGVSGYCRITGADSSGVKMYEAVGGSNSSSGSAEIEVNGGFWNSSASVTSVSIFSNNANFTAGTVFVYTTN